MALAERASQAVEEVIALRRLFAWLPTSPNYDANTEWYQVDADAMAFGTTQMAEPFWWERSVCELVNRSVPALPTWTIRRELFPTPSGFFLFAQPLDLPVGPGSDGSEIHSPLAALSWAGADGDSVSMMGWQPNSDRRFGVSVLPGRGGHGRIGASVGGADSQTMLRKSATEVDITDGVSLRGRYVLRALGACLLFLEQRVLVSAQERPDRAARRRFEKADIEYPELRVVRLRTPSVSARSFDGSPVDWQFRWVVRGHWRQQWHASDGSHRPKWITPYIKGPDDKPVKAPKASVFAVVR